MLRRERQVALRDSIAYFVVEPSVQRDVNQRACSEAESPRPRPGDPRRRPGSKEHGLDDQHGDELEGIRPEGAIQEQAQVDGGDADDRHPPGYKGGGSSHRRTPFRKADHPRFKSSLDRRLQERSAAERKGRASPPPARLVVPLASTPEARPRRTASFIIAITMHATGQADHNQGFRLMRPTTPNTVPAPRMSRPALKGPMIRLRRICDLSGNDLRRPLWGQFGDQ